MSESSRTRDSNIPSSHTMRMHRKKMSLLLAKGKRYCIILVLLFHSSDPTRSKNKTMTIRMILRRLMVVLFCYLRAVVSFSTTTRTAHHQLVHDANNKIKISSPSPVLFLSNDPSNDDGDNNNSNDSNNDNTNTNNKNISPIESIQNSFGFQSEKFKEASADGFGTRARNAAINATVGDILVPLCSNLEMRQQLANQGIYAGVEYKVCSLQVLAAAAKNENEKVENVQSLKGIDAERKQKGGVTAMVQPAYPLRKHLERDDWPVPVQLEDVPLWLSKATYEAGTAVGTLFFSSSILFSAAILAFFLRFVAVPTPSMVPALNPGNIILVTRSIPSIGLLRPKVGDVIFFDAPSELDIAVNKFANEQQQQQQQQQQQASNPDSSSGGIDTMTTTTTTTTTTTSTKGKQFVKRVVAIPGEKVGVKQSSPYVELSDTKFRFDVIGPYARPEVFPASSWDRPVSTLGRDEYFVAGDNGYRSVDSRVWGPLKGRYIVGTAKWVLWPLNDFGPIQQGQISEVTKSKN